MLDHMATLFLVFLRSFHTVFHSGCTNFPSHQQQGWGGSLFATLSPTFIICRCLNNGHSDWCELVPHCSLDLHLSNKCLMEHLSMCLLPICMSSLEISRFKASAKFLIVLFIFLLLNYMSFCIFWKVSHWAHHLQIFSPIS